MERDGSSGSGSSSGSGEGERLLGDEPAATAGAAAEDRISAGGSMGCGERFRRVWRTMGPHWWLLIGTASAWFLLDVTLYANTLFSGEWRQACLEVESPELAPPPLS